MEQPRILNPTPVSEVHLPRAPLVRVIAQVRFPTILAIRDPDKVAVVQEKLRDSYPYLSLDQVHSIEVNDKQVPNVRPDLVWRLADLEKEVRWRVSLGVDFVSLETTNYHTRNDFLDRLKTLITAVEHSFTPALATRLGLRYIAQLKNEAFENVSNLIRPEILGVIRTPVDSDTMLKDSVIHMMTEAQFEAHDSSRVQGRWGMLPPNVTYAPDALEPYSKRSWILDLDMFTSESRPFAHNELITTAESFAETQYWIFRQMVTEEFLKFYGGNP